jgi:hypothetical protein
MVKRKVGDKSEGKKGSSSSKTKGSEKSKKKGQEDQGASYSIPNGKGAINVSTSHYKGKDYVDIRHFYLDNEDELKPTPKGIAIPEEKAVAVYKKLRRLLKERGLLE